MARKPQSRDARSPRDRLSRDFLQNFAEDFALNGIAVIKALREKSPERYAELAAKVIMQAEEPDDESLKNAQSMEEIGRRLLKTVGVGEPTKRQIAAAIKINDKFVKGLERLAVVANDEANENLEPNATQIKHEVKQFENYLAGKQ